MGFDGTTFAWRRFHAGVFLGGVAVRGESPKSKSVSLSSSARTGALRLAGTFGGGIWEPVFRGYINEQKSRSMVLTVSSI